MVLVLMQTKATTVKAIASQTQTVTAFAIHSKWAVVRMIQLATTVQKLPTTMAHAPMLMRVTIAMATA